MVEVNNFSIIRHAIGLLLALCLILAGIFLFTIAVITGEAHAGFFIIFPVFIGTGIYAFIGILLIMLGIGLLVFVFGLLPIIHATEVSAEPLEEKTEQQQQRRKVEGGGIILIGPFPIIFGSSPKFTFWLIILTIILIALACLLFFIVYLIKVF